MIDQESDLTELFIAHRNERGTEIIAYAEHNQDLVAGKNWFGSRRKQTPQAIVEIKISRVSARRSSQPEGFPAAKPGSRRQCSNDDKNPESDRAVKKFMTRP